MIRRLALVVALVGLACVPASQGGTRAAPVLVYEKGDAVWVARVDGSGARQLTEGFAPRVSPDGQLVAFLRSSPTGKASLYQIGTGQGKTETSLLARDVDDFAWSPDSRRLAYEAGLQLVVFEVGGAKVTIDRAPKRFGSFLGFGFSPDGRDLVWVKPVRTMGTVYAGDLYRAPVRGGKILRLTRDGRNTDPVWGPDAIAFARFEPGTAATPFRRPSQLWTIGSDGTGEHRLSSARKLKPVAWSTDGRRLLACFVAEFSCAPAAVDPRAGTVRALPVAAGKSAVTFALSRDGRFVLVSQGFFEVSQDVAQLPYAGGAATVLVRDADWPHWNR